jgi:hypothetical protein
LRPDPRSRSWKKAHDPVGNHRARGRIWTPGAADPPPGIAFVNFEETWVVYQFSVFVRCFKLTVQQHIGFYLSNRRKAMLKRYL